MPSSVKPTGALESASSLSQAKSLRQSASSASLQEQIEAAVRGGGHRGADLELRVGDPADDVAGVFGGEFEIAGGEGEAVDVVELGVLPVERDEQRVGEVAALVQDLGLHAVEGGEVAVLLRGRVHGVHAPVLVAALVLEVDDVPVVLRPEADPDAAFAIVGNGLEVLERGPDRSDPDVQNAVFGARKARRSPSGERRGPIRSGLPNRTSRGIRGTVMVPPCGRHSISAGQHFSVTKFSSCWQVCTDDLWAWRGSCATLKHVGHGVEAGLCIGGEPGGAEGAVGEGAAGEGAVCDLDLFATRVEDETVLAYDRAAAQGVDADLTLSPGRETFPPVDRDLVQVLPLPSAAARARNRAVPEGASFLFLWCASTTSMS